MQLISIQFEHILRWELVRIVSNSSIYIFRINSIQRRNVCVCYNFHSANDRDFVLNFFGAYRKQPGFFLD